MSNDQPITERPKIESLMAHLLETWDQRYNFNLDREKKIIKFSIPNFAITAEETDDGKIRVFYEQDGKIYERIGDIKDSAYAIEGAMFPSTVSEEGIAENLQVKSRSWWQFWK